MLTCEVCGKELKIISGRHLKFHDMTSSEYKEKYPEAETISREFREATSKGTIKNQYKNRSKEDTIKGIVAKRKQNNPNWFSDNYVHWTKSKTITEEEKIDIKKRIGKKSLATKIKNNSIASGEKNGMYGKSLYDVWLEKYGKEGADAKYKVWIKKCSYRSKGKKNPMYGKPAPKGSGIGRKTKYKGITFRSTWEAKVAEYFDNNSINWDYEFQTFELENGMTYTPDFSIWVGDINEAQIIEVKGYMDDVSRTKIDLFEEQYKIPIHVWDDVKLKELEIL